MEAILKYTVTSCVISLYFVCSTVPFVVVIAWIWSNGCVLCGVVLLDLFFRTSNMCCNVLLFVTNCWHAPDSILCTSLRNAVQKTPIFEIWFNVHCVQLVPRACRRCRRFSEFERPGHLVLFSSRINQRDCIHYSTSTMREMCAVRRVVICDEGWEHCAPKATVHGIYKKAVKAIVYLRVFTITILLIINKYEYDTKWWSAQLYSFSFLQHCTNR